MWLSQRWQDFELIDAGDGMKLERWGDIILSRPEPQAVWPVSECSAWEKADAVYHRSNTGGGSWEFKRKIPESWLISYGSLKFKVKPTGFKHTGLFPEQATNWDFMSEKIKNTGRKITVLNLFAYTGGATLACAKAGADVVHVDASKGIISWVKENAEISGLKDASIRYIVDDCLKFVLREQRRGRKYDAIVMDPPSYGRGPDGQMFKFEDDIYKLVEACIHLLSEQPLFVILNSYTAGFAPQITENILKCVIKSGTVVSDNLGLSLRNGLKLPCGAAARWVP